MTSQIPATRSSILIVDDETKMSSVLARMLGREGYHAEATDDPLHALELLQSNPVDIVLCDLRMPGMSGVDLLERAKRHNPNIDFVMMTAYATPQTAVESMKLGAIDYLIKPFAIEDMKAVIERVDRSRREKNEVADETASNVSTSETPHSLPLSASAPVAASSANDLEVDGLIASSSIMREVLARARKVARSNAGVLLQGESGTGKEVFARFIHRLSPRANGPLITVNCGAIPENLMESELLGHAKGAFTGAADMRRGHFETANGGTIFLDEIGEMPLHLQVKLLRVLQENEIQRVGESQSVKVDVRVIAATNRDLAQAVQKGDFRQDLYYRLSVIPIHLPPLRERSEDLNMLIEHFLQRYGGSGSKRLSSEARALLMRYDYPGNIRELENAIEHAVVLSDADEISVGDLPFQIQNFEWTRGTGAPSTAAIGHMHLEDVEKHCILSALEKTRYNFTRAAAHLGITRRTLGYRIQKYGLEKVVEENARKEKLGPANGE